MLHSGPRVAALQRNPHFKGRLDADVMELQGRKQTYHGRRGDCGYQRQRVMLGCFAAGQAIATAAHALQESGDGQTRQPASIKVESNHIRCTDDAARAGQIKKQLSVDGTNHTTNSIQLCETVKVLLLSVRLTVSASRRDPRSPRQSPPQACDEPSESASCVWSQRVNPQTAHLRLCAEFLLEKKIGHWWRVRKADLNAQLAGGESC